MRTVHEWLTGRVLFPYTTEPVAVIPPSPRRGPRIVGAAAAAAFLLLGLTAVGVSYAAPASVDPTPTIVQFVYVSDSHYGVSRDSFMGAQKVDAHIVNQTMVRRINSLGKAQLPDDGGVMAGRKVGGVEFLVHSGDIANRQEASRSVQSAAASWKQFQGDCLDGLSLRNSLNRVPMICLLPGNHDVSNAIGYYKPLRPPVDATPMAEMYNRMLNPAAPRTKSTYRFATDRITYSRNIKGVHLVLVGVWPDAAARKWMDADLQTVSSNTPVLLFTHDQPDVESKHFTNPNGKHDINDKDAFENVIPDEFQDGPTAASPSTLEQNALAAFLARHRNVKAYFHGNENFNEFYVWTCPDKTVSIPVFRVDSPMRGNVSGADETKLSFQVGAIDTAAGRMTVRECFWNASTQLCWGASITVSVKCSPQAAASTGRN